MSAQPLIRPGMRLDELQRLARLDPLECRILVCHVLQLTRAQLISQSERQLGPQEADQLSRLFQRRLAGEPIAYITGIREFYGLDFRVSSEVLIPRPETELLVDLAIEWLPQGGRLLDLGTGSGAIAIAVAHARPDAAVTALDASDAALQVARQNAERLLSGRSPIRFLQSDWYAACVDGERFDLVVSNPPYIPLGDAHLTQGDLRFEPVDALTDHDDGLSAIRRITAGTAEQLKRGGWLLMEHGFDQGESVRELLLGNHFSLVQTWQDLAGLDRVTGGQLQS